MKFHIFSSIIIVMALLSGCNNEPFPLNNNLKYPATKQVDQVDNYFGTSVSDPYRWLENDTSAETAEWVTAQNKVTDAYLQAIPFRDQIKKRLEKMWNFPKYTAPFSKGKWIFYTKNDGLQNQNVLFVQEGLQGNPRMLLDPNTFSLDGTIALGDMSVSNDGNYLAYSINKAGSDWSEIYVLEVESGKILPDKIEWVKFSGASWKGDGFFYSCYDAPKKGKELSNVNEFHKVYYHKLGTTQPEDRLIYENRKYPLRNYYASVTQDERFLILSENESTNGNALYVKDLSKGNGDFVKIAEGFRYEYSVIDNLEEKLLILTNDSAPKRKLVLVDPAHPSVAEWKTIIPEQPDVLENVTPAGGRLFAQYMKDASNHLFAYSFEGKLLEEIGLPSLGTLISFNGDKNSDVAFYGFTSFIYPTSVYSYHISAKKSELFYKPEIDFDPSKYEVKQVFYASKDGTRIPMFIVHKKGLSLNGKNPAMLYGYGGFNVSLTPSFSVSRLLLLENDGVYALANLRGGGEYGEEWHEAGTKLRKQNVFDDFIAAAEFLIKEKYTSSEKLAILGGSNGGLLVGACMTQRPDLFRVCLPAVGVMDMLRYHKFTIGWAWAGDYGSSDDSTQFRYLLGYSPLHNLKDSVCYPSTLITTGDHDDRVVPAHSFKFAATLQAKQNCNNPVLIRIETKAGHGAGKPTSKLIEEMADVYSFMFYNLGITPRK